MKLCMIDFLADSTLKISDVPINVTVICFCLHFPLVVVNSS